MLVFKACAYEADLAEVGHVVTYDPVDVVHHQPCCVLVAGGVEVASHVEVVADVRAGSVVGCVFAQVDQVDVVEHFGHLAYDVGELAPVVSVARHGDYKYLCVGLN